MIVIEKYTKYKHRGGRVYITGEEKPTCPCGGIMKPHDRRSRKGISPTGEITVYAIRRLICSTCGKVHAELPGELAPRKHYTAESMADPSVCTADDSTIRRWKNNTAKEKKP